MGIAAHAVAPKLHRALVEELPARRSRVADKDDPVMAEARQILASLVSGLPDPELALWMIDTVAYAVIHRATVERRRGPVRRRACRGVDDPAAAGYILR